MAKGCGTRQGSNHCSVLELEACRMPGYRLRALMPQSMVGTNQAVGPKVLFLTLVREPIDRAISEFFWAKRGAPREIFACPDPDYCTLSAEKVRKLLIGDRGECVECVSK